MENIPLGKVTLWMLYSLCLCQVAHAEPVQPNVALSGDACNSITGLYQVAGEYLSTPLQYSKVRMDWALFLRETGGKRTGVELTWNSSDDVLAVKILGENLFPPESVSYLIKSSCLDGKIIYEVDHEGYSEGGAKNKAHMKAQLFKESDGNLILHGKIQVESTELLLFRSTDENEISARFYPLLRQ